MYGVPVDQLTDEMSSEATAQSSSLQAQRAFNWAIVISAIRCTLAYIVLPFAIPFLGVAPGVGPWLGLIIGIVAIAANVYSIRRFSRSGHRLRRPIIAINYTAIALLLVMLAIDLNTVFNGAV